MQKGSLTSTVESKKAGDDDVLTLPEEKMKLEAFIDIRKKSEILTYEQELTLITQLVENAKKICETHKTGREHLNECYFYRALTHYERCEYELAAHDADRAKELSSFRDFYLDFLSELPKKIRKFGITIDEFKKLLANFSLEKFATDNTEAKVDSDSNSEVVEVLPKNPDDPVLGLIDKISKLGIAPVRKTLGLKPATLNAVPSSRESKKDKPRGAGSGVVSAKLKETTRAEAEGLYEQVKVFQDQGKAVEARALAKKILENPAGLSELERNNLALIVKAGASFLEISEEPSSPRPG